jgi:hypothetical protein
MDEFIEVVLDLAPDLVPGESVIDVEFHVAGLSRRWLPVRGRADPHVLP